MILSGSHIFLVVLLSITEMAALKARKGGGNIFAGDLKQGCFPDALLPLGNLWMCEQDDRLIAYTV